MSRRTVLVVAVVVVAGAGCRQLLGFDDPVVHDAPVVDAEVDATIPDAGPCAAIGAECVGDLRRVCTSVGAFPTDHLCSWGCVSAPDAHCGRLFPAGGGAIDTDLDPDPQIQDIVLGAVTIDTNDGSISGVRSPGGGVQNGIGFSTNNSVGVFRFHRLTITGPVTITGSRAAALIAHSAVQLDGELDLRGGCENGAAGPGGGDGGSPNNDGRPGTNSTLGGGGGGDAAGNDTSGGGGGGHGGIGGTGNGPLAVPKAGGGLDSGSAVIALLNGGGGGGGGGGSSGGRGGGGGGALQIAANGAIAIAGTARINAGGCGGKPGTQSGGGGGAGGTILLEAPTITLGPGAILAANGGGGGGGGSTEGENGEASADRASGGLGANGGTGGRGGAADALDGEISAPGTRNGGGGGGAVGRIRLTTRTGAAAIDGAALLSPVLGAAATQGPADVR